MPRASTIGSGRRSSIEAAGVGPLVLASPSLQDPATATTPLAGMTPSTPLSSSRRPRLSTGGWGAGAAAGGEIGRAHV